MVASGRSRCAIGPGDEEDEPTQWVDETTRDDEPSITLPGLPEGFDEAAPPAAGPTPLAPEPMTSWIPAFQKPSEVETQRLELADETLIELRDQLKAVLEEPETAEASPPPPPPRTRTEPPAPSRRGPTRADTVAITAGSSLAGFAAVVVITLVVLGVLALTQLGS